jgi:hypothetical protein
MKTNRTENKPGVWASSILLVKLLLFLVAIPLLLPTIALILQALVWRYILCRIDGINFTGDILEAFAFSLALAGFAACANLLVSVISDAVKKLSKLPVEKFAQRKTPEIATWADMQKVLPGFRVLSQNIIVYALALAFFSSLQPVRLHFDGVFQLLLAAGVLCAIWIFCVTGMSVVVYALVIKSQKAKAAASKAVI